MILTSERRAAFRRVILFYDDPALSHSILKFADLLPLVFENFPNADVMVYNNDNNIVSLYQPPPARTLTLLPSAAIDSLQTWLYPGAADATLTLRFRKSIDPTDISDQVCGPTLFFRTFGNQKYFEDEEVDVYLPWRQDVLRHRIAVSGDTIRTRQREILISLGFDGVPQGPGGSVLGDEQFSPELQEQIEAYQTRYPQLRDGRPVVLANVLKKMDGFWVHHGETAHSVKCRWMLVLEKISAELAVTLIINEGPQEWRCQEAQPYPATWLDPAAPTWCRQTAHGEILSIYQHLQSATNAKAHLLRIAGEPINVTRLAALYQVTKKSGGALLDVHTGSSHLAEWMHTPEVLQHSHVTGEMIESRPNLRRVSSPHFELSRDERGEVMPGRGIATHGARAQFAHDVISALREIL